jgi:hypothetical protein
MLWRLGRSMLRPYNCQAKILSLALFVFRVLANHTDYAAAVNHLAFVANLFY